MTVSLTLIRVQRWHADKIYHFTIDECHHKLDHLIKIQAISSLILLSSPHLRCFLLIRTEVACWFKLELDI
jgi:type III secretory pathway component EscS